MRENPDDDEIHTIASAWLKYHTTKDKADWWACDRVMDWTAEGGQLDALWRTILALCAGVDENDTFTISHIGAGPLESMLGEFGDAAMDLIEPALAGNPTLLKALACVWGWNEPVRPRVDRVLAEHGQERL